MRIKGTDLDLTCVADIYQLRSADGLCVTFTHYSELSSLGMCERGYFVGKLQTGDTLTTVCSLQGKKAFLVYEAVNNWGMI